MACGALARPLRRGVEAGVAHHPDSRHVKAPQYSGAWITEIRGLRWSRTAPMNLDHFWGMTLMRLRSLRLRLKAMPAPKRGRGPGTGWPWAMGSAIVISFTPKVSLPEM